MKIKKYIINNLWMKKKDLFFLSMLLLLQVILSLIIPLYIQKYLDQAFTIKNINPLVIIIISYIILNFILYLVNIFSKYLSEKIGWDISNNLRISILDKILSYDQNFFNQNSTGQLMQYMDRDILIIYKFISEKLINFIINTLLILGILIVFYNQSISIGIIFSLYLIGSLICILKNIKVDKNILYTHKKVTSDNIGKYSEWLNAKKDIQLMDGISYIEKKIDLMNEELLPIEIKSQKYLYKVWSLTLLLVAIANSLCLFIGGNLFLNHIISLGMVYLLYSYSNLLKEPFENLQSQIQMFLNAKSSIKRLNELMEYTSEVKDGDKKVTSDFLSIAFENMTYIYQDDTKAALKNINIIIKPNEKIGIMGKSGSGKSTFCKVICKLLEPTKGSVFIDDINISEISTENLRANIAYVSTNAPIFNTTLKNNLTLFDQTISEKEIMEKLKEYNLLTYLQRDKSNFLENMITENDLSSGEKQIISLCRVLFKKRKIVIFDEASSRLDPTVERIFHYVFNKVIKDTTTIIVSHELNTLKYCNKIVVFDDAEIVENDFKNKLEKNFNSAYYKIIESKEGVV